jgi:predicted kinase
MPDDSRSRPKLIIVCGIIGTGKSSVARGMAESKGWVMVSSDFVRKELAKIPATRHEYVAFDQGIYSSEFTAKTYEKMNQIAEQLLMEDRSVVMDATFAKREYRAKTYAMAKRLNVEFSCIELICPDEEIKRRLTLRMERKNEISDGRWEIFSKQKASFQKIDDFQDEEHIVLDASGPEKESIARALNMIAGRSR